MEEIQIFDERTNKKVNVFIPKGVAEKCRTDANFAAELVRQIEEQNIEEGSYIEIESVAHMGHSLAGTSIEKELWSRSETLKFLQLYQKYHKKYGENKNILWMMISKELERRHILKPPERCRSKWKNLSRTYKSAKGRNNMTRFQYHKAVDDVQNGIPIILSDSESDLESCNEDEVLAEIYYMKSQAKLNVDKESWSKFATITLIKAYQTFQQALVNNLYTKDQIWIFISDELLKEGVVKTPEKCSLKWKNLVRTYKKVLEKDQQDITPRFKYFKEMNDLMNQREVIVINNEMSDSSEEIFDNGDEHEEMETNVEYRIKYNEFTESEIEKMLYAYNKHEDVLPNKEQFWNLVAKELEAEGFSRTALECQQEWELVQSGQSKYAIMDSVGEPIEIDAVEFSETADTENDSTIITDEGNVQTYEKIIIETEDASESATSSINNWSDAETSNLIVFCVKHIKNSKTKNVPDSIWETISSSLQSIGISKSVEACKLKWEDLYNTYETCTNLNLDCKKFSFFEAIHGALNSDEQASSEIVCNISCSCSKKRAQEKQQRHMDRMELLKRQLDIEERKIMAFEEYVKYLKR